MDHAGVVVGVHGQSEVMSHQSYATVTVNRNIQYRKSKGMVNVPLLVKGIHLTTDYKYCQ